MLARILAAVIGLLVAAALAVLAWPEFFGLTQAPVVAQVVALRGTAAAIAIILAILLTLISFVWRGARGFLAAVAVFLIAFAAVNVTVLVSRGWFGNGMPEPGPAAVTVLAWNTLGETPSAEVVADLVEETGAQAVSLPETGYDRGAEVVALLAERGIVMQQFTFAYDQIAKANSTTLLISDQLGEYRADTRTVTTHNRPSLVATPVDGIGPAIAAVHTTAPGFSDQNEWREDLEWVAALCAEPNLIVAGDFNSTIDHWAPLADPATPGARIGTCADAAEQAGSGGIGTWPAVLPALLGAPIDHVLVGPAWTVDGFRVVGSEDGSGSDHRPVVAVLSEVAP